MLLNGSQIVVECLVEQGVDTVFGYPGGAILNIYDELYKNQDRIHHILTAHEQGASHAADGYARSTGKVGVCMATSGPGATNLVTGIATAYMDSSPIVAITCNVPTPLLGRDSFQEIDITGITMPITKHNFMVHKVEDLAATIREAFIIAKSGRPGPVLIDIPKEVTANQTEFEPLKNLSDAKLELSKDKDNLRRVFNAAVPTDEEIAKAAEIINSAKRPVIYAGGGIIISEAAEKLKELAVKADIPVSESMMARSAFPSSNALNLGMVGMHGTKASNMAVTESDLVLALGAR
ncbi:MAG: acetolactate synthase large subunit, partial [Treponema sp.]|nr:acetolactate synthase large subunit [Treponema sp.]